MSNQLNIDPVGVLIDGSNLFDRCYHALKHKSSQDLTENFIAYSFIYQIKCLLNKMNTLNPIPFIAWDSKNSSQLRKKIFPLYKGNRKERDTLSLETRSNLIINLRKVSPRLSIELENAEADDIISILPSIEPEIPKWVICTRDADMLQLITDNILYYNTHTKEYWDRLKFKKKYGFPPELFGIFKAIVGDSSDNWPGVVGIGPKTASKLIGNDFEAEGMVHIQERITTALNTPKREKDFITGMKLCSLPFINDHVDNWKNILKTLISTGKVGNWSEIHDIYQITNTKNAKFRIGKT